MRVDWREVAVGITLDQTAHIEEQAFLTLTAQQAVVDAQAELVVAAFDEDVGLGKAVLVHVPADDGRELAAAGGMVVVFRMYPAVGTEAFFLRVVSHVAGLDQHQPLAVLGEGSVPVRRDHRAAAAVVERKRAEMLADHDDRLALVFVGTESARGQYLAWLETKRLDVIVEAGNEAAVAERGAVEAEVIDQFLDIGG